ncbi:hypothetical protein LAZ67_2001037 [Cordylochernes scorpioides]|uniref:Reverse transcriptase domain-containing protein n=1 Tax=Cordylochernes scorpioides TaxID=51811 RepID=A0ABY6K175_9ARAC|nr:hypothetical protein LAZ67_2001037 [Cordylochernes scorpioides]
MIDQTVKELTNILIEAAHNSLKVNNNMTTKNNISNKWWNTNLQLLKGHCHYLRNCYYRNKNCPDHIKQYYKSIRNKYLREIEKARKASRRNFLEENKSNNPYGNLYKVYKNIKSGSKRKRNMQILEGNTDMECLQKGEELLNNLFPDDKCEEDTNIHKSIRNYNLKLLNKEKPMVMITEVNDLIDKLNPKKSPGIDNISNNMIRHTKQFIAPILVKLFQKCLDIQYYPAEWKRAEAIIILKPGKTDFNNYKNYRPLCLNSNISKIFEKIINNRIIKYYEDFNLLKHKAREYAAIIAVDISAAFDNAWWPALMKRLDEDGVQASMIKLLQSYFDNRRIRLRYSSTEINKKLSKGCPQGGPLSPTLWNILINEILNNNLDDNCETIGYADDITLICWNKTPEQLRKTIDNVLRKINKWCESRKLKLSDEKTKILYLYKCNSDIIVSGSKLIKPVEELKILGVTIKNHRVRSKLDFTPHVNEMIIKLRLRGHTLDTITKQAVKFCDDATDAGQLIVTNINCQSLSAHAADIETDTVIPRSDYLVLTETWMRDTCEPTPIKGYECVSRENNRPNSDTNAAGGVAIYRKLSSTSTAEVFQVAITDVTRVIKTKGDMCMTEVTCFSANTSFKFILGAVYIHPGASMQDIGMLLWQGLGPYIHNSQYVPPFVQVDSSIPILLCVSLQRCRNSNNIHDRQKYIEARREYFKLLQRKRDEFNKDKNERIKNAKDPKSFWNAIASFRKKPIIQENKEATFTVNQMIGWKDPDLDAEITLEEIHDVVKKLANGKAVGLDGIPNELLKNLPIPTLNKLKNLFNKIMSTEKYPQLWTNSIVHPIYKSGDKNNPTNYRGIALCSNISKLFTTILRNRLNNWIEKRMIILENQAGFRKNRSCTDHIILLNSLIQLSLRRKRGKLYVFFVDLTKAFDTVPHDLLWQKLHKMGISNKFVMLIKNFYQEAKITIRWKGQYSNNVKINSGVLQGESLSPLLFILYMADLIELYNNSALTGFHLPDFGVLHLLMYADDIAIIGESKINLQIKINLLKSYLDKNKLVLNENKSKIIVFRNGGRPARHENWYWGDTPLTVASNITYLGYPFTSTINSKKVALFYKAKANTAINATIRLIKKEKINSLKVALNLFDSVIKSILLYAAPVWAWDNTDIIDQLQNTFIKIFLKSTKIYTRVHCKAGNRQNIFDFYNDQINFEIFH